MSDSIAIWFPAAWDWPGTAVLTVSFFIKDRILIWKHILSRQVVSHPARQENDFTRNWWHKRCTWIMTACVGGDWNLWRKAASKPLLWQQDFSSVEVNAIASRTKQNKIESHIFRVQAIRIAMSGHNWRGHFAQARLVLSWLNHKLLWLLHIQAFTLCSAKALEIYLFWVNTL